MKIFSRLGFAIIIFFISPLAQAKTASHAQALAALTPPPGKIWHGTFVGHLFPDAEHGEVERVTLKGIKSYEKAVGKSVAWVTFANDWFQSRKFPKAKAGWIRNHGAVPYIRLMLRSDPFQEHAEPLFTTQAIARGDFDADLTKWAKAAARFETPLLVEYGTEVNGEWFPWNGIWNGKAKGVVHFKNAFRHIIDITRANGASNIVWVFHLNYLDGPQERWNRFENYYPGDDYIDWLGISIYSTLSPFGTETTPFRRVGRTVRRLDKMAPSKPIIISEFGTDIRNPNEPAYIWARQALSDLIGGRWPRIIGFNWWNERWPNGGKPERATDLRVKADANLKRVFRNQLAKPAVAP